ncbi:9760_t:CDS:2 [Paraglomus brasilianum]|uniref:9760_t:CDS:1 n=1 Tax=Paraglomus brasilianum TaxID=144538 RepID=A0A9N8VFB0_9GLOM|nr:9760_t:CDS:2 [Paraglomus brasilianum]
MEIEATGYKIQKKRVGIYVMHDIDKLTDGVQKVLISKDEFQKGLKGNTDHLRELILMGNVKNLDLNEDVQWTLHTLNERLHVNRYGRA